MSKPFAMQQVVDAMTQCTLKLDSLRRNKTTRDMRMVVTMAYGGAITDDGGQFYGDFEIITNAVDATVRENFYSRCACTASGFGMRGALAGFRACSQPYTSRHAWPASLSLGAWAEWQLAE
jgi:hypothetical protein